MGCACAGSAIAFAGAFYQGLGYGESIQTAFNLGCNQIELRALGHADVPRLLVRSGIRPEEIRPMESAALPSMAELRGPQIKTRGYDVDREAALKVALRQEDSRVIAVATGLELLLKLRQPHPALVAYMDLKVAAPR